MILPILNIIRKLVNKYVQVSIQAAYKLGLYLMASLIILSTIIAAIPMGNMNLVDRCNSLRKCIPIDMKIHKNTKKVIILIMMNNYRANYDDNYYYQDQQQQQSSYNNNYDGYEDNKKISYEQ